MHSNTDLLLNFIPFHSIPFTHHFPHTTRPALLACWAPERPPDPDPPWVWLEADSVSSDRCRLRVNWPPPLGVEFPRILFGHLCHGKVLKWMLDFVEDFLGGIRLY